jgi:O-acetylhomoserine/O-acetylserine sulfhydrylase-like pyridoxal-dependent enzyme
MASVTTVLAFVERHTSGLIIVDENVYHETRHLVRTGALRARTRIVSSDDVVEAVRDLRPAVVLVDAVSNTRDVRIADLAGIARVVERPARLAARPIVLVDTTVCSMVAPAVQQLLEVPDVRVVLVESLTKHAQLGFDRIPAGIIVADHHDAGALDSLREHLGTNIADVASMSLPRPDRVTLQHRLARASRNATLIATALEAHGAEACHPALTGHNDHGRWVDGGTTCSLITLPAQPAHELPDELADDGGAAQLARWFAVAEPRGVRLDHGAGFGFDVTRTYRTSRSVPEADEMLRIAAGTEPIDVIVDVARALTAGLLPAWRVLRPCLESVAVPDDSTVRIFASSEARP